MSKKMMKRSMALGALMAFVITGNALAAELTIDNQESFGDWQDGGIDSWYMDDNIPETYCIVSEDSTSGNKINISYNAQYEGLGMLIGGAGEKANDNVINISGGSFGGYFSVYGGYGSEEANNNIVTIKGGSFTGGTQIIGGVSVSGNKVIIEGGTFSNQTEIIATDMSVASENGALSVKNNEVIITNAVFNAQTNIYVATVVGNAQVSNNTLTIGQGVEFNGNAYIAPVSDTSQANSSNNTLNINDGWTNEGKSINTIGDFDTIAIKSADINKPLNVTNLNLKQRNDDGTGGTAIVVEKLQLGSGAQEGESVKLFNTTNSTGDIDEDNSKATVYVGTAEMGTASIGNSQSGGIDLTIKGLDMNPQVLVIGESRAAATAFVNQGSELVETGLDALARDNAKAGNTKVFAAVYGNASEYATGSHIKVNGWSGIVGIGKTNDNGLTVGAFFENGDGNYRTYNVNAGTFMRGDGEAVYNGGGLLVRKDNANGVYTEASLRMGNLKNELKNAVMGKAGLDGYDVDTFYYGAHVGIGKVIPRGNEGDSIDVYGKFMYTHHDGETFNIQGDDYKFDSVDSERLRLGFRINEVQTSKLSMYYGAAWEYEFGGDADNKVVGYDLSTPSLGGSTMIGEIGMHYLASEKWSLDLNVRGYSGQRDGFTGSVQANYNF